MNNVSVDTRDVLNLFANLNRRNQYKAYRNALKKGASILVKAAKKELKNKIGSKIDSKNWWNGKSLGSGIRYSINKEVTAAKIHILGDFRLKFFENGTNERNTKKGFNRGSIKNNKYHFFDTAKQSTENEIFSNINMLIAESIQKVAKKSKLR